MTGYLRKVFEYSEVGLTKCDCPHFGWRRPSLLWRKSKSRRERRQIPFPTQRHERSHEGKQTRRTNKRAEGDTEEKSVNWTHAPVCQSGFAISGLLSSLQQTKSVTYKQSMSLAGQCYRNSRHGIWTNWSAVIEAVKMPTMKRSPSVRCNLCPYFHSSYLRRNPADRLLTTIDSNVIGPESH